MKKKVLDSNGLGGTYTSHYEDCTFSLDKIDDLAGTCDVTFYSISTSPFGTIDVDSSFENKARFMYNNDYYPGLITLSVYYSFKVSSSINVYLVDSWCGSLDSDRQITLMGTRYYKMNIFDRAVKTPLSKRVFSYDG